MKFSKSLIIVIILPLFLYFPSLSGEFLAFDDELLVLDNATVHGLNFSNVTEAFTTYDPELYVPLTLLTYQIEWSLVQDNPLLYHITNLLIHILSSLFVYLILKKFFTEKIAVICALIFALHPIQVEAVAWISGRKDLLASMFFLASTYTYLKWKDEDKY
ncbi:MAG: glycosyltransferase family 39 protein, partial [Candidatus Peribacteraceae bacterium]|nr:glycosyltransferase family 39 protein [Candidatus Peribacteraceae bacterium]